MKKGHYTLPTKKGWLKKDRQEAFNMKRAWFINAWRIVDEQGADMFQPWCRTKYEALTMAARLGIDVQNPKEPLT